MSSEGAKEDSRSLALTPTTSIAIVMTIFVLISVFLEQSIRYLSNWLKKMKRNPMLAAVEKIKEELMLLGFISLLLAVTSSSISNICIPSKFYDNAFSPCSTPDNNQENKDSKSEILNKLNQNMCLKDYEPFVSDEGLEQLHRFIFIIAVTHIHQWRIWEDDAQMDPHDVLTEISRSETMRRQSAIVKFHVSNPLVRNGFLTWMICFFRQFGNSVVRADYLMLRKAFIMNHNLTSKFDFHSYMIRSMEEEFHKIVGLSGPLWGFVVAFMLFNVKGSNLYFWIALLPVTLALVMGTKLQHVIATLALESAGITAYFTQTKLKPRDELFWFKKPGWQFGYNSCFLKHHLMVYLRLILGFGGQFFCSYSTLPLYALVTQMGTNYKDAMIPQRIRETIDGLRKEARRRRKYINNGDDSTVISVDESDHHELDYPRTTTTHLERSEIELQPPILRLSASMSSSPTPSYLLEIHRLPFHFPLHLPFHEPHLPVNFQLVVDIVAMEDIAAMEDMMVGVEECMLVVDIQGQCRLFQVVERDMLADYIRVQAGVGRRVEVDTLDGYILVQVGVDRLVQAGVGKWVEVDMLGGYILVQVVVDRLVWVGVGKWVEVDTLGGYILVQVVVDRLVRVGVGKWVEVDTLGGYILVQVVVDRLVQAGVGKWVEVDTLGGYILVQVVVDRLVQAGVGKWVEVDTLDGYILVQVGVDRLVLVGVGRRVEVDMLGGYILARVGEGMPVVVGEGRMVRAGVGSLVVVEVDMLGGYILVRVGVDRLAQAGVGRMVGVDKLGGYILARVGEGMPVVVGEGRMVRAGVGSLVVVEVDMLGGYILVLVGVDRLVRDGAGRQVVVDMLGGYILAQAGEGMPVEVGEGKMVQAEEGSLVVVEVDMLDGYIPVRVGEGKPVGVEADTLGGYNLAQDKLVGAGAGEGALVGVGRRVEAANLE
ncbi:hypothetical protein LXL04_016491 [Taraxacum kok-saghyz]